MRWLTSVTLAVLPSAVAAQQSPKTWIEQAKLKESYGAELDQFGNDVAISGETAVIGVPGDDAAGTNSGSAYVYVRGAMGWTLQAILSASDAEGNEHFATSVALEGDTAVIGAVWDRHEPGLGWPGGQGSAYVFTRSGTVWTEAAKLVASDPDWGSWFGAAVSVSLGTIVVGAPYQEVPNVQKGAAYVFAPSGATWSETGRLVASDGERDDLFGQSVSIEGQTLIVGAPQDDLAPGALGGSGEGSSYEFVFGGASWSERAKLTAESPAQRDRFGISVALDGDTLLIGADDVVSGSGVGPGQAYVLVRGGTTWSQEAELAAAGGASGDRFGSAVALDGDSAWVGAPSSTPAGNTNSGAAYLFRRAGTTWPQETKAIAVDAECCEWFGGSVAVAGDTLIAGANADDHGLGPFDLVKGLAFRPSTNRLYGVDTGTDRLLDIDPAGGGATPIGPIGFAHVHGLAFDPSTATLYATEVLNDQLLVLDTATGAGTAIGPTGFPNVRGLAFDPFANVLYGADVTTNELITIDPSTGAGTAVGPTGLVAGIGGLAFDPTAGVLYGTNAQTDRLVTFDTATGLATNVGIMGYTPTDGLAMDSIANKLLAASTSQDALLWVSAATGNTQQILGFFGEFTNVGSAYVFVDVGPCVSCVSYCTAGTSAGGCNALLNAVGTPSASAPEGFVVRARFTPGTKNGLFFFGANGRQAQSWGNGTSYQCVTPPVKRAGLMFGTGTAGACDGSMAQDLNALWASHPAKNPGAASVVQVQLWYRDQQNTSNKGTSLSDAIEFTVAP
jgi:DNA-binding beta-propeller fold protein YncE